MTVSEGSRSRAEGLGLRAALLPLSSSAACCTPHRDEVAKLFWTRYFMREFTIAAAGCELFKAAAGCTQSKDAARHGIWIGHE